MSQKRYTVYQIVAKLRKADVGPMASTSLPDRSSFFPAIGQLLPDVAIKKGVRSKQ